MLPNFLILGAQKCATSWLHHHLRRHPDVFMPENKELEYFSYSEHLQRIGTRGYEAQFEQRESETWLGEATASYFWSAASPPMWGAQLAGFNPAIPEAIRDTLGDDVRLIVSLRDPIQRTLSAYLHHIVHGSVDPAVGLLDAGVELGIVSMGFYGAHLARYLECFSPDQILVLIMERDIVDQPQVGLDKVCAHLGIDKLAPSDLSRAVFPGSSRRRTEQGIEARRADTSWGLVADNDTLNILRIAFGHDLDQLESLLDQDLGSLWPLAKGSD